MSETSDRASNAATPEQRPRQIWWNDGRVQKEWEFTQQALKLANNSKNIDVLKGLLEQRSRELSSLKNVYDWSVPLAYGLGGSLGLGLGLGLLSEGTCDFGFFLFFLAIFHFWEWFYASLFHPESCTIDSFMVTHSREFHIAMAVAFSEYIIERLLFPSMKSNWIIMVPALLVVIAGQAIRTLAMITAGKSFHHIIQEDKDDEHKLVTEGIYQYLRHPSYFGWFWWSIGMAVLLASPITIGVFAFGSFTFFKDRIPYEEETLVKMFGKDYENYRRKTPTGIPMIP